MSPEFILHPGLEQDTVAEAIATDHRLAAAREVMREEIAWFRKLDDDTLRRIASSASPCTPERLYSLSELDRRADSERQPGDSGWSHRVA